MMLALALIISFAAGITVGLQFQHIIGGLRAAIDAVRDTQKVERKKNSGVVRPGNAKPYQEPEATTSKSAVVRPRVPVPDPNDTNEALASVRNRTANI